MTVSTANITFPSSGTMIFNQDDAVSAAITVSGTYPTLTGPLTIQVGGSNTNNGPVTISGVISDGGHGYSITKTSNGTNILGSANTYTGGTTVSAGMLTANVTGSLGSGALSIASGALVTLPNGTTETVAGLFTNGVRGVAGTYGGTFSSATYKNGTYFPGSTTGTLTALSGTANAYKITAASGTPAGGASDALTIKLVDSAGNTDTTFAGDKTLTFSGLNNAPGGAVPTVTDKTGTPQNLGVSTTISFTNGVSSAGGVLVAYKAEGPVTLAATDGTFSTTTTGGAGASLTVSAGAAASIALTSGNSQSGTVTAALGSPFVVTVTDANGNPKSATSVTFAIATTPVGATGQTLSTTTTTTSGTGQASSTLTLGTKAGAYSVTATSSGLTGSPATFNATGNAGTAAATTVETAANGSGLVVGAQNVTAGNSVTVYAVTRDANGNFVGNPSATWSLQSITGGVVSGDLVAGGASAVFTGHKVGGAIIRAVATFTGNSGVQTVIAGAATATTVETAANGSGLVVGAQNVTAGNTITVYAITRDAQGNFVANPSATWSLQSITGGVVSGDLTPTTGASSTLTGHKVGSATIQAVASGFTGNSGVQTVIAGAASQLVFTSTAVSTTAGVASSAITVQRQDQYNNPNTTDATINLTMSSTSTGTKTFNAASPSIANGSSSTTFTYADTQVGTPTITAHSGSLTDGTQQETVTKATPTISGVMATPSVTYGTTSVILTGTVSATGGASTVYALNGDTVSVTINGHGVNGTVSGGSGGFTITYNDASLATDGVGSSPYTITYGYAGDANLNAAANNTSTSLTVNKASLSITAPTIASKPYDGTATAGAVTVGTISGEANGEVVTATATAADYSSANAGSYPNDTVTYTLHNGTGLAANYSLANGSATGTITALAVQLSGTRVYDGTTTADYSILSVANKVGSDTVNVASGSGTLAGANAGSEAISSLGTLLLGNNTAGNYTLSGASGSVTIGKASTTSGVTTSGSPVNLGTSVTFTDTLTLTSGAGTPTGNVRFRDGTAAKGTNALNGSAVATFSISSLTSGEHVISAEYAGDANFYGSTNVVAQIINQPPGTVNHNPTPGTHNLSTSMNTPLTFSASALARLDTDPDGDSLTITAVNSPSAQNGTITLSANIITYTPTTSFVGTDSFTYTISDGFGGTATSTANVTVSLGVATSAFNGIVVAGGVANLRGYGIPNHQYDVQRSPDTSFSSYIIVPGSPVTAAASGIIIFTDTNPPDGGAYYRFAVHTN